MGTHQSSSEKYIIFHPLWKLPPRWWKFVILNNGFPNFLVTYSLTYFNVRSLEGPSPLKRLYTPLPFYPSSPCSSFYCSILVSTTHLSQYSDRQGDLMSWGGRIGIRVSVSIYKSWQHHPGCQEGEYKHRSHWVNGMRFWWQQVRRGIAPGHSRW